MTLQHKKKKEPLHVATATSFPPAVASGHFNLAVDKLTVDCDLHEL